MKKIYYLFFVGILFSCSPKKGSYSYYEKKIIKIGELTNEFNDNKNDISYYELLKTFDSTRVIAKEKLQRAKYSSEISQKENSRILNEMVILRKEIPDSVFYKLEDVDIQILNWTDYYITNHNKK